MLSRAGSRTDVWWTHVRVRGLAAPLTHLKLEIESPELFSRSSV